VVTFDVFVVHGGAGVVAAWLRDDDDGEPLVPLPIPPSATTGRQRLRHISLRSPCPRPV
jgi:hypothetical protein